MGRDKAGIKPYHEQDEALTISQTRKKPGWEARRPRRDAGRLGAVPRGGGY